MTSDLVENFCYCTSNLVEVTLDLVKNFYCCTSDLVEVTSNLTEGFYCSLGTQRPVAQEENKIANGA